jgi:hypothetical protein
MERGEVHGAVGTRDGPRSIVSARQPFHQARMKSSAWTGSFLIPGQVHVDGARSVPDLPPCGSRAARLPSTR